jgi:tetratricopeptide (TPR) repeat protein
VATGVLGFCIAFSQAALAVDRLAIAMQLLQEEQFDEAAEMLGRLTDDEPDNAEAWFQLGLAFHQAGKYDRAIDAHLRVANFPEFESTGLYNAACAYALLGQTDLAFTMLSRSQDAGFLNLEHIREDADLASIRKDPRFAELRGYKYRTIEVEEKELTYALLLPDDFDPERSYPVMLAMPPGAQDKAAVDFGMNSFWGLQASSRDWVVVSPVAPADGWGEGGGRAELLALLGDLTDQVRPEGGRLHLVGCSVGGISAFHLALESPGSFHSLTVIPGAQPPTRAGATTRPSPWPP